MECCVVSDTVSKLCLCSFSRPDMTGVRIPTLYEAVNTCVRLDLLMLLELKGNLQQVCNCDSYREVLHPVTTYSQYKL